MTYPFNLILLLCVLLSVAPLACTSAEDAGADDNALHIAYLESYTGALASNGINFERVLFLVEDSVNAAGGVAGRPLRFVAADTHSDPARSIQATQSLLSPPEVLALLGPDSPEIAQQLQSTIEQFAIPHILPGTSTLTTITSPQKNLWIQTGPSAEGMGCALAQRIYQDGHRKIVILFTSDLLMSAFAYQMEDTLKTFFSSALNKAQTTLIPTENTASSLSDAWRTALAFAPDAVVIVMPTSAAAQSIRFRPQSIASAQFYFGPGALNDILLANTSPNELNNAFGIGPTVSAKDEAAALDALYEQSYGDRPFPNAYYYYDSAALIALAIESASSTQSPPQSSTPTRQDLLTHIPRVSNPPGERIRWNELPRGLELLRQGQDIDYQGISGFLSIGPDNTIDRSLSDYRIERVDNNKISFHTWTVCN